MPLILFTEILRWESIKQLSELMLSYVDVKLGNKSGHWKVAKLWMTSARADLSTNIELNDFMKGEDKIDFIKAWRVRRTCYVKNWIIWNKLTDYLIGSHLQAGLVEGQERDEKMMLEKTCAGSWWKTSAQILNAP